MEHQKLFTITRQNFQKGIDLSKYKAATCSQPRMYTQGLIASYPLYPAEEYNMNPRDMVPLSLSYVMPHQTKNTTVCPSGIILQVNAKEWLPLDATKDKSVLLDVRDNHILLYCPVGQTYLKSTSKTDPLLLQVDAKCTPVLTPCTGVELEMTSLGAGFVTPNFNSQAQEYLGKKLRKGVGVKPAASVPLEAVLAKAAQSCSDGDKCQQPEREQ